MTRGGVNPTVGCNFRVNSAGGTCDMRIGGAAGMPFILVAGDLDFSTPIPFTSPTEYVDLDLTTYTIVGDGFGGTAGGLPPEICALSGAGLFNLSFSANPGMAGMTIAFQSVVYDPTLPPLNINMTAACAYDFFTVAAPIGTQLGANLTGDDSGATFTSATSYNLYGAARTQFSVSTNGLIRMASSANNTFTETPAGFIADAGLAPQIAVDWEDQLMTGVGTAVKVYEDAGAKTIQFRWENGFYYSGGAGNAWGTLVCTIQEVAGVCSVTFDYNGYAPVTAPSEGIIGISDGSLATLPNDQGDLITNCAVNPYTASGDFSTYFQSFDGSGTTPAQAIDVAGRVITFQDISATGSGQWDVY